VHLLLTLGVPTSHRRSGTTFAGFWVDLQRLAPGFLSLLSPDGGHGYSNIVTISGLSVFHRDNTFFGNHASGHLRSRNRRDNFDARRWRTKPKTF
jgi:hypothetical protein